MDHIKHTMQADLYNLHTDWLKHIEQERALSAHTIRAYSKCVGDFFLFMHQYKNSPLTLSCLENMQVYEFRAFLSHCINNGMQHISVNRTLSALKNFLTFLKQYHHIHNPNLSKLKTAKYKKQIPKALEFQEIENIIDIITQNTSPPWIADRNKAILLLLYGCGLRISEAVSIKKNNIYEDYIIITGKGNKERYVPLLTTIRQSITHYMDTCPYNIEDYVFFSIRGKNLHPNTFSAVLRNLRNTYNLPCHMTAHAFRHSFATHLLHSGCNLRNIQALLGHENLSTTQIYTKVDTGKLLGEYKKYHPGNSEE